MHIFQVRLEFEPRDMWIGVYWTRGDMWTIPEMDGRDRMFQSWEIYVCLIPMLPIHVTIGTRARLRPPEETP